MSDKEIALENDKNFGYHGLKVEQLKLSDL